MRRLPPRHASLRRNDHAAHAGTNGFGELNAELEAYPSADPEKRLGY
jgi:hypothetical protein